jgi:hypothetical protein
MATSNKAREIVEREALAVRLFRSRVRNFFSALFCAQASTPAEHAKKTNELAEPI